MFNLRDNSLKGKNPCSYLKKKCTDEYNSAGLSIHGL